MSDIDSTKTPKKCGWCGRRHNGRREECRDCHVMTRNREPDHTDALIGGSWQYSRSRGVQVWVKAS